MVRDARGFLKMVALERGFGRFREGGLRPEVKRLGLPLFNHAYQPIEKNGVFSIAVKPMKRLSKMPVGCM
jgi:hypothetical protein